MSPGIKARPEKWVNYLITTGMVGSVGILMVALFAWQRPLSGRLQLQAGQVAPYDIIAPRDLRYESKLLTEQAKARAAQAIPDQYESLDSGIRRERVSRSREILDQITQLRNDPNITPQVQLDQLLALNDVSMTLQLALQIQDLTPEDWVAVVTEASAVVDRVMREEIRDTTLALTQRRVPAFISADLSEPAAQVTAGLVQGLIRPNSVFNAERTQELRTIASTDTPLQYGTFMRGEAIIRRGEIADSQDVEALTQLGLLQQEWDSRMLLRAVAFTVLILLLVIGAIYRLRPATLHNHQEMAILVVLAVLWLLGAKFMIVPDDWLPYLYPLAALGMLATVLVDLRVAMVLTIALSLTIHFFDEINSVLVAYMCAGSVIGALALGRAERLSAFLWAGLSVTLSNVLTYIAYRTTFTEFDQPILFDRIWETYAVVLLNGVLSASVALVGYFIFGNLFNITTSLQLTELSRPTHPLLRQLLLKAPGTYHHTIVVSNLAERAAAAIGADAFLARVGAYYHDIGKTVRPYFFTENIADISSPHDKLDPTTSAQIIISHVNDGIDLAQKYHLPQRIQDFIREHHGRTLVQYFYSQALRLAGEGAGVTEEDFRYPGPRPRSKETAILLLADMCEAAVRSVRPATREELDRLVRKLIDERVDDGELSESDLTFKDLQTIRDIFLQVLQGVHHPRIAYPDPLKSLKEATKTDIPVVAANGKDRPPRPTDAAHPVGGEEEDVISLASTIRYREA
jgi:putative nucleotidyltransferase with HDIG domain